MATGSLVIQQQKMWEDILNKSGEQELMLKTRGKIMAYWTPCVMPGQP